MLSFSYLCTVLKFNVMSKYLNQIVFQLLTFNRDSGWTLDSTWQSFDDARIRVNQLKYDCDCRIVEVSYRNVFIQKKVNQ